MSETAEIVKREVGEKVKLHLNFEKDSTKALEDGTFEAIITTSSLDRHNEQIVTEGVDTDNYMANNPVVLYGHDYFGMPIGKTLSLKKMKNKITAKFQLAVQEYEFAATVASMIKSGYLNAVSIGGVVREWSEDYRTILQMEMVEFSVVSIPANSEAIITGKSLEEATGKSLETISKEYEDFNRGNMLDKLKHMPDDEVSMAIKVLESVVATLKESHQANSSAGDAEPIEVKRIKKVRLMQAAKAVDAEAERVIRVIKLKS
jgi:HK97 family phage prohead protease